MEINEMNYELYALDYAEGRLEGDELEAMEAFVSTHPELAAELAAIAAVSVPHEPAVFDNKAMLKQNGRPVAILPVALAFTSAACLVLAVGLIWLVGQNKSFGELAEASGAEISPLEERIEIRGEQQLVNPSVYIAGPQSTDEIKIQPDGRNDWVATEVPGRDDDIQEGGLRVQEEMPGHVIAVTTSAAGETVNLITERNFVMPVTLEVHDLEEYAGQMQGSGTAPARLQEDEKLARRQMIKDGALSLLQERLMPSGVLDLFSN